MLKTRDLVIGSGERGLRRDLDENNRISGIRGSRCSSQSCTKENDDGVRNEYLEV